MESCRTSTSTNHSTQLQHPRSNCLVCTEWPNNLEEGWRRMDQKTTKKHLLNSSRSSSRSSGHFIITGILQSYVFWRKTFSSRILGGDLESINCKNVGFHGSHPSCLGGESIGIQQKCQTFPCFFLQFGNPTKVPGLVASLDQMVVSRWWLSHLNSQKK